MATLSFIDKLELLWEVTKSSNIFLVALIILLLLGIILFTTNKMNLKSSRKVFSLIYIFIAVAIIVMYKESLLNMFDYMMNNLFIVIYFPNIAIYLGAIILTTIILWISVFNFKTTKIIRNINIIMYCIINYLLFVLLNIINEQKLDVFDQTSLYGNKNAQAIIELSSLIFIVWIIFLGLYKAIRIFQTKDNELPNKEYIIKNPKRKIPSNIIEVPHPKTVRSPKLTIKNIHKDNISEFDKLLTVDDYKLLLSILKAKREEKELERLRKEKEEKQLAKFHELQELYRVR